jgi:ligand-binding sensor domain-containing protein/signal transduction histidine kinase
MRWGVLLIGIVAVTSAVARAELLPVRSYSTADGLASDRINDITADSRGFLWFSTTEGLSRFDGYHFVTYGTEDGLPDRNVVAVREGRSGDRWVGTGHGLARIADGPAARIVGVRLGPAADDNDVRALATSRSHEIWVGTAGGLFEGLDRDHFRRCDVTLPGQQHISTMAEDLTGRLWIGTPAGIVLLGERGIEQAFSARTGLPGDWTERLLRDSKGRIWAGVRGGLAEFRVPDTGPPVLEKVYADQLVNGVVTAMTEASDGTLWAGTEQGISRLRWTGGGEPEIDHVTRSQGLSDRWTKALAEDPTGNMWVGTESAGAMRIGRVGFMTYREQDGLSSDRVWSVLESQAGDLLAVTIRQVRWRSDSVDVLTGGHFRTMALGVFGDKPGWGWNQVLLQSRTGEWWAATHQGLCRYGVTSADRLDGRAPVACYAPETESFSLFEDSRGGIWTSGQSAIGDRLMRWNPATNAIEEFPYPRAPSRAARRPADDLVVAFAEDRQGNVWMGLFKGGLYRYDGRTFRYFQDRHGVPSGSILSLLVTDAGLWIGSQGGGLGRMAHPEAEHPAITIYNRGAGMSSDVIECLVADQRGDIYAGTGEGLDRLDPSTAHVRHFTAADGLGHGAFHGAVRDHSGTLWFATTQGLSRLAPGDDPPPVAPRVYITDLRIAGAAYAVSQLGETRIALRALEPNQNSLQVGFVGIDYQPGAVVRYSYRLDGGDPKWSPPRDQQSVSLAALTAGSYRFLVRAVTADGVESPSPAEVDFTVLAPVWRRAWFLAVALLGLVALAAVAHRARVAHMVGLERVRTAIATDLHDDIGASLSQIAILSEVARLSPDRRGAGAGEPLERVATLARELVDSMGDIVWSIRSDSGSWDALIRRMREFALDLLAPQSIDFRFRTPPTDGVRLSLEFRRQLFLMFKECIHNAARHARASVVAVELHAGSRELVLIVADDGVGLTSPTQTPPGGGTGLAGLRRRAENLGGRLEIRSAPGSGCRVAIYLPVGRGVRTPLRS